MKTLLAFLLISNIAFAQNNAVADCNTIFICIDSISYNTIFSNAFIKDSIFITKEAKTQTNNDAYTGKYAVGKAANLEFFQPKPNGKFGDRLGDFGIEFKTRNPNAIKNLIDEARKSKIAIDSSLTQLTESDTIIPWYQTLKLSHTKENSEFSFIAYQKEYLNYLGFSEAEIQQEMSFESFNEKLADGRKYPRQFDKISAITLQLDKKEAVLLEQFFLLNRMKKKDNYFYNSEIKIVLEISKTLTKTRIKNITLHLLDAQKSRTIKVSEKIYFKIKEHVCKIEFLQ